MGTPQTKVSKLLVELVKNYPPLPLHNSSPPYRLDFFSTVTVASLSLLWIESVRSTSRRRPRLRPAETKELLGLCCCDRVSPIRDVESETETPRSSCADSDNGSEVSSLWAGERSDDPTNPKRKEKRSLRKLIAKKLHNGKKQPKEKDPSGKQPHATGEAGSNAEPVKSDTLAASTEQTPSESSRGEEEELDGRGSTLPFAAVIPVVLVGLVAGKLPAVALTVLCVVFSSSVERLPAS